MSQAGQSKETIREPPTDLASKVAVAPELPGVYSFFAAPGEGRQILYVGKAKNLRKRLQSYLRDKLPPKTEALMKATGDLDATVTNNETEALLLEQTLIKQHRPRFNVLLRDDKSYPFLHLSDHKDFPCLMVRRGNQVKSGRLFGPYSSGQALRRTLQLMQAVFRIRQCSDDFFANRSRPCLQYQIGRCTAPCMGNISAEEYSRDIQMAVESIRGRNDKVAGMLQSQMDKAAAAQDYEGAAVFRDRLIALRKVQEQQSVARREGQVDVVAVVVQHGVLCIHQLNIRLGKVVASSSVFPGGSVLPNVEQGEGMDTGKAELLEQYISQHYLQDSYRPDMPRELFVNHRLADKKPLESALEQQQGHRVSIVANPRGERAAWLRLAEKNAEQALLARLSNRRNHYARVLELASQLNLERPPARLECFDISHTFGEATVASRVVFGAEGPQKSAYRIYNLEGITPGDDYAAMRQALSRRFGKKGKEPLPDLLLIDGGKGQVMMALEVLAGLEIDLMVVGVAKGPGRKAGLETLFVHRPGAQRLASSLPQLQLRPESGAMHLVQHIRDEAHRFALGRHRQRRAKTRKTSQLEGISGVGPARRRELLRYFGSLQGVANASEHDLARVNGISQALAASIYGHFH